LPLRETRRQFIIWDFDGQDVLVCIDGDYVAFLNYGDGASVEGFGGDVGDHEAVGGSAESAVCDEGDAIGEAGSDDGSGDS